jgi:lipopolysaccharide assembly protein A
MQIFLLIALGIATIAVIFALQNITTVTISFMFWSIKGSLALVLLVTLMAGVLISSLVSLPGFVGGKWTTSSRKKQLASLENERNLYKQRAEAAEQEVKDLEVQLANLSADYDQSPPERPSQNT